MSPLRNPRLARRVIGSPSLRMSQYIEGEEKIDIFTILRVNNSGCCWGNPGKARFAIGTSQFPPIGSPAPESNQAGLTLAWWAMFSRTNRPGSLPALSILLITVGETPIACAIAEQLPPHTL